MAISHILTSIFQTEHISAVKFLIGCEKYLNFLLLSKFQKVWETSEILDQILLNENWGFMKYQITQVELAEIVTLFVWNLFVIVQYFLCVGRHCITDIQGKFQILRMYDILS